MRWEIHASLIEVQGCIERAMDTPSVKAWKYRLIETSASREYQFTHAKFGDIGKIKLSVLPRAWTELYSYGPDEPDDTWLVQFLPMHVSEKPMSAVLLSLLQVYAWQTEQHVFNLTGTELLQLAHSKRDIDWGWEKYGLGDDELRKQALAEMDQWRKRILARRTSELEGILGTIEGQIRMDALPMKKWDLKGHAIEIPARQDPQAIEANQERLEKLKHKGRYRLTGDEIRERKKVVKKAEKMRRESPSMTWKQIANELDIPERTLRDWRHNNY